MGRRVTFSNFQSSIKFHFNSKTDLWSSFISKFSKNLWEFWNSTLRPAPSFTRDNWHLVVPVLTCSVTQPSSRKYSKAMMKKWLDSLKISALRGPFFWVRLQVLMVRLEVMKAIQRPIFCLGEGQNYLQQNTCSCFKLLPREQILVLWTWAYKFYKSVTSTNNFCISCIGQKSTPSILGYVPFFHFEKNHRSLQHVFPKTVVSSYFSPSKKARNPVLKKLSNTIHLWGEPSSCESQLPPNLPGSFEGDANARWQAWRPRTNLKPPCFWGGTFFGQFFFKMAIFGIYVDSWW